MQYGDEIEVLANGPFINAKSLQPLGITDGSLCWGIWTGGIATRNQNRQKENWQIPHLIVSPIHPDSWPISFNLRVILRDYSGSLAQFLDAIKECNVDIQFADCSFAGYDHVVLNLIGKFSDLIDWKKDFCRFYLEKKNQQRLNEMWLASDKRVGDELPPNGNREGPIYLEAVLQALQVRNKRPAPDAITEFKIDRTLVQRKASKLTSDLIRRCALEWLGRKLLGRLTALWVVVRLKEHELYESSWKAEQKKGLRPPIKEWKWSFNSEVDMDPQGDYFFTSKSVQTGRRPWNIEIPFAPSWSEDFPDDKLRVEFKAFKGLWKTYPPILDEVEGDGLEWFKDGKQKVAELYKNVSHTLDLIHATRADNHKPRLSREAVLAKQHNDPSAWINAVMERILRNNWLHPYVSHAMYELTHASIWKHDTEPLVFRYDAALGQLKALSDDAFRSDFLRVIKDESPNRGAIGLADAFPRIAIASFNTKERFLRLRFIRRKVSDLQIVSFDIDFKVLLEPRTDTEAPNLPGKNKAEAHKGEAPSSTGLLQLLCKTAGKHSLNLLRVTTRLKAKYPANYGYPILEEGTIKLVGRRQHPMREGEVGRFESIFRDCLKDPESNVPFREHIELNPRVTPWRTARIFWSTVFSHDREPELYALAHDAAEKFGFRLERVETRTAQTTRRIRDEIDKCDGVLQLICLRDADKPKAQFSEAWQPEYVWLHSEYAIGYALDKPIIRAIDKSMPERIQTEFDKVDRDVPVEHIDLRSSQSTLLNAFESIMSEFRSKLSER